MAKVKGASKLTVLAEGVAIARSRPVVLLATIVIAAIGIGTPSLLRAETIRSNDRAIASFERPEFRTLVVTSNAEQPVLTEQLSVAISGFSSVARVIATGQAMTARPAENWPTGAALPLSPVLTANGECGSVLVPGSIPFPESMTFHLDSQLAYLPVGGRRDGTLARVIAPDVIVLVECDWSTATRFVIEFESNQGLVDSTPLIVEMIASSEINVASPTDVARTRAQVRDELTSASKALTVGAVMSTGILIGMTSLISTLTQIRHYARRRALGARRSETALLIYMQPAISVALGAALFGIAQLLAGLAGATFLGSELKIVLSTWIVVSFVTGVMVVPSAAIAATADPASLLRVP